MNRTGKKLGIGVIGVGRLGRHHAEHLRFRIPAARLVAVADSNSERARKVASELEIEHSYAHWEALLERKDIDAVAVAAPSRFHAPITCAAAAAGKHIFCEKPPALSLEEAQNAARAVARAGAQFQMGFMRRYDPAYVIAKNRLNAGEIGDPVLIKCVGRDGQPAPPSFFQDGINGTLFLDAMIHEFDLARWLVNDEVAEVHAFGSALSVPELAEFRDVDSAVVNLRFERGAIGNAECHRKSNYGYDIRTEILGSKGAIQIGYLRETAELLLTSAGSSHDIVDHWTVRFADAYRNEVADFVESILAERPVRVTLEDGIRAMAISLAAERSFRESRPVALGSPPKSAVSTPR